MKKLSIRFITYVMVFAICLGQMAITETIFAATESGSDAEIEQAVSLGLVPDALQNAADLENTICYAEYCQMIRRVINAKDPKMLSKWDQIAASAIASEKPMKREDAMMTVYEAAVILGHGEYGNGVWGVAQNEISIGAHSFEISGYYPEWPNAEEIAPMLRVSGEKPQCTYIQAAYNYAAMEYSFVSLKHIFDYDRENKDLHMLDALTVKDAIHTALRFYESLISECSQQQEDEIRAKAAVRKEEILNSETKIVKAEQTVPGVSYSGTAYYVSATEGSDDNDGLSPQTPFQTLERVWAQAFQTENALTYGDAVFFKRGDIWRGETLTCIEGVTYSAYGEGEKPKFYGSPESGADASKWEIYYEGENGEKIWKYYQDMTDTGGVIFDNGAAWAGRIWGWWSVAKQQYVQYDHPELAFTPETCLTEDMTCCSMIDYSGEAYPIHRYVLNKKGGLYVRCDAGNPGELYTEVEFETTDAPNDWKPIFRCVKDCTLDNLSILYWGDKAIDCMDNTTTGMHVQNCEIGWGGNCVLTYMQEEPTTENWVSGDGIYGICSDSIVENTYCHEVDGGAVTTERKDAEETIGTFTCQNNLMERCGQAVLLQDWNGAMHYEGVNIIGNIMLDIGEGYCHGCLCAISNIDILDTASFTKKTVIQDNLAFGKTARLLRYDGLGQLQMTGNAMYLRVEKACTHQYTEVKKEPSYEEAGYTAKVCSLCGDETDYIWIRPLSCMGEAALYEDEAYTVCKKELGKFTDIAALNASLTGESGYLKIQLEKDAVWTELPGNSTIKAVMVSTKQAEQNPFTITWQSAQMSLQTDLWIQTDVKIDNAMVLDGCGHCLTLQNMHLTGSKLSTKNLRMICGETIFLEADIDGLQVFSVNDVLKITKTADGTEVQDWKNRFDHADVIILGTIAGTEKTAFYGNNLYISSTGALSTDEITGIYGNILLQKQNGKLPAFTVKKTMQNMLWQIRLYAYEKLTDTDVAATKAEKLLAVDEGTALVTLSAEADESCEKKLGFMTVMDQDWTNYEHKFRQNNVLYFGRMQQTPEEDTPDKKEDSDIYGNVFQNAYGIPEAKKTLLYDKTYVYKVISSKQGSAKLEVVKPRKNTQKSLTIPASTTYNGVTYQITSIAAQAFKNNKKLNRIVIGKNINTIGQKAFSGCKNLKNITVKSTLLKKTGVKKNCLKGTNKKLKIKVPKKKYKTYRQIFKGKGNKNVKIVK